MNRLSWNGMAMNADSNGEYYNADEADKLIANLQSKLDALMFEHCPDEMSRMQIKEYEKHVKVKK